MNRENKWKSIMKEIKKDALKINEKELNGFCFLFIGVSILMSIVNIVGASYFMAGILAVFTLLLIGVMLIYRKTRNPIAVMACMASGVYSLLVYFLITGGESGFSSIWILLVPPVAVYFFQLFFGGIFSILLGITVIVYMWTPLYMLGYDYTKVYLIRFPVVYLVTLVVSLVVQYQIWFSRRKRKEAYRKVEEANTAKGIFLSNMSHEARTPINAILGYNEMILRESKESGTLAYASNIQAAGRTLLSIVNDTLDFTSIQDGVLYLEKEPYSMLTVLQDLVSYGNFNAEKKKLDFRIELSEDLPQNLIGDALRITQICTNLISNAIKYTNNGYVCLNINWKQTEEHKGQLCVAVRDTGIGIHEEDIAKLGTSFTRVDERNTKNIQGIGLGLPLVTRLLQMMGSHLEVHSEYGKGTEFSFEVEQEVAGVERVGKRTMEKEKAEDVMYAGKEYFSIPSAKILIVDDNMMNLDLLKGMLQRVQAIVELAVNGEEAIGKVRENAYDLIIMDHMMPLLDGMEALQVLQEEKLCPNVPVVVLTANAVAGAKEMYLEAGFSAYLSKPVLAKDLYDLLKKILPSNLIVWESKEDTVQIPEAEKDFLEQLDFLNTTTGMSYCCDNEAFYKEMLHAFAEKEKLEDIEAFYEVRDWENYRILVHALKSTSLSIGAEQLSEMAKQLELAAKEENHYFIDSHHDAAMKEYRRILNGIEAAFEEKQAEHVLTAVSEKNGHILIVDDDTMNLKIAEKMLENRFDVECISSGKEALKFLENNHPELILLDLHMPEMDGFEVMGLLRENPLTKEIPVVFLTADNDREVEIRGFKEGAQDFITKPFVADIMIQRVSRIMELSRLQKDLQKEVEKQTKKAEDRRRQVERLSDQIINALAETIDAKDTYTNGHSMRVAQYSREIAKRVGKTEEEQERIYYMGMLHDIGKIGIPDSIITKNSSLSDKEYFVTRKHPEIGAEILATISEIPDLGVGARWHHERYDGTGYPDGLKGTDIPEEARMIAVADAYDAMASKRSYRDVLPQKIVYEEIKKGKGTQFDPAFADIMLSLMDEDKEYQMREK